MVADENVTLGSARPVHSMSTHMHSGVQRPSGGLTALRSRVSRRAKGVCHRDDATVWT
jgi:hypothetical protein